MNERFIRIPAYLDCRDDTSAMALDRKFSELLERADVQRLPDGRWQAIDSNQYDGPGSPIGYGDTPDEAFADLAEAVQ